MSTSPEIELDPAAQTILPQSVKVPEDPALSGVFRVLGTLEIIGGIVLGISLWPRQTYDVEPIRFLPAVSWIVAGAIFGCLFLAVAEGLAYLSQISFYTRWSLSLTKAEWLSRPKV